MGSSCFASSVEFAAGNASVTFSLVGNSTLQVTLTNTSLMTATSPSDVLTGVYFTTQQQLLSPVMAYVNNAQSLLNCSACTNASTDISAEWAFQNSVSGVLPTTAVNLLGAADFGTFSLNDRFGSNNVSGTTGVGGIDFGIVGSGTGQSAYTGSPLVGRQAIFVFDSPTGFNVNAIGSVGFIYGNAYFGGGWGGTLDEAPEPQTWLLMGLGLGALGWFRNKRHAG